MFFAFFAMHLKWLCIVFALLSTLRLSEGQTPTFESVDGRAYGILYGGVADTLVGRITGGACGTPATTTYIRYTPVITAATDDCFVLPAAPTAPTYDAGSGGAGGEHSEVQTTPDFAVYVAPDTIDTAAADSDTAVDENTGVATLLTLTTTTSTFYYDCGTALNAIDTTNAAYFNFAPGTAGNAATITWKKALINDPILFLGRIRCLFSHQNNANYATASTASLRTVVDFTITPPLAADADITCSLNPIAANAGRNVIVGTYSYGRTAAVTLPCTATTTSTATGTTPADFLALQNAAKCFGQVTLNAVSTFAANDIVTLEVADSGVGQAAKTGTCSYTVTADVAPPTCSSAVSGRVDLQYWRDATATATDNANVLVDKAIATSSGRALTYSIDASSDYTFVQNTLQVKAAAAKTKVDGVYTIMVTAADTQYPSLNAACEVSLTVGPQNCVP